MNALRIPRISAALAAGITLAAISPAPAQTIVTTTWNGASGDWSDSAQWTGNPTGYGYPNNSAAARFYVTINGGVASIYDYFTIERLTMAGGTLGGDGILVVNGNASFANATLSGQAQTRLNGATTQSGALSLTGNHTLVNTGAYNWVGALNLGAYTSFLNGGTVTSAGNTSRTATGADATATFTNEGTFTKSGTATTTFSGLRFDNTGSGNVSITGGTLSLDGGGLSSGNFTGTGTIAFRGGYTLSGGTVSTTNVAFSGVPATTNVLDTGATLSGASVTVTSGTTQINGAYNATATSLRGGTAAFNADSTTGTLTLNGGTLGGTGRLSVATTATLTSGTMTGAGLTQLLKGSSTAQTGTLNLDDRRVLMNDGTYNWTGALNLANGAIFQNNGTLLSAGNAARTAALTAGSGLFVNTGTFTKTGTGTTTFSTLPFLNLGGTVDIQAGTLSLAGGGQANGSFTGAGTVAFRGGYQLGADVSTANVVFSGDPLLPNIQGSGTITSNSVTVSSGLTQFAAAYGPGATSLLGGTANFQAPDAITGALIMNGGTLGGTGRLTVTGNATLTNARMLDGGQTRLQGTTTQAGALTLENGRMLLNTGTFNWTAGFNLANGAIFENDGTIVSAGTAARTAALTAGSGVFANTGTFTKSGTGTTTFSTLPFLNMGGTVDVQAGTLSLAGGGQANGSFTGAGTVAFRGGYQLGANVSTANVVFSGDPLLPNIQGAGAITSNSVTIASGLTQFAAAYSPGATSLLGGTANFQSLDATTGTLTMNGGILGGSGRLTVTGNATLANARMIESGQTSLQGSTTQSGTLTLDNGRMLRNTGTFNWSAGLDLANSALFFNEGTVVAAGSTNRTAVLTSGLANFANRGLFTKSGTGTTTFSTLPFYNFAGTVDVQGGTLSLAGGGTSNGDFTGAGTVAFRGGYQVAGGHISTANVVFSGTAANPNFISADSFTSANVSFASGTTGIYGGYAAGATSIAGTATFEGTATTKTLSLATTGILGGTGTINVTGDATLAGGTMRDAGHTHLFGTTTQTGTLTLSGLRTLQNEGTFNQRGDIAIADGAMIINRGTFATGGTGTRTISNAAGSTYFVNTGTFTSSATTNVTGMALDNTGRIDVQAGTLTFTGPVIQTMGGALYRGDWNVGNGTSTAALALTDPALQPITGIAPDARVTLNGTRATFAQINTLTANAGTFRLLGGRNFTVLGGGVFTNSGTLELGGGARFTSAGGIANLSTGTLRGIGTIAGPVESAGLIAPGASPGLLTFSNNLTLDPTSVIQLELGGTARGTEYDALNVNGLLTFDGLLEVTPYGSYDPAAGASFDLFNWLTATGNFANVDLPTLGNGLTWDTSQLYSSGVITVIPEPSTYAAFLGAAALLVALAKRRRGAARESRESASS